METAIRSRRTQGVFGRMTGLIPFAIAIVALVALAWWLHWLQGGVAS